MHEQPTILNLIEEMIDHIISHMNVYSATGFETGVEELIDFHSFLLQAHAVRTDSAMESYASASSFDQPLYKKWRYSYRRLMDKAAELISTDTTYFSTISSIPNRLLPTNYLDLPESIICDILDFNVQLIHTLEKWVGSHKIEKSNQAAQDFTNHLSTLDTKAYENTLLRLLGNWDSLSQHAAELYNWKEAQDSGTTEYYWEHLSKSWPYLFHHLRNTAYFVTISAWNNDIVGVKDFSSSLLRWMDFTIYELGYSKDYLFENTTFLDGCLADLPWDSFNKAVRPYMFQDVSGASSESIEGVMSSTLSNGKKDVIILTCCILVRWMLDRSNLSPLIPYTIKGLCSGSLSGEEYMFERTYIEFDDIIHHIFRLHSANGQGRTYLKSLGEWVRNADGVSEKRHMFGRSYTPSTMHGIDDSTVSLGVCALSLFSKLSSSRIEFSLRNFAEILQHEEFFLELDQSVRSVKNSLTRILEQVDSLEKETLHRTIIALSGTPEATESFRAYIRKLVSIIDQRRLERIRSRAPDPKLLEEIRQNLLQFVSQNHAGVGILKAFDIAISEQTEQQKTEKFTLLCDKGAFTVPSMSYIQTTNVEKQLTDKFTQYFQSRVWDNFLDKKRTVVHFKTKSGFWKKVAALAQDIDQPTLFVGSWLDYPESKLLQRNPFKGLNFTVNKGSKETGYILNVNNIDVLKLNDECVDNRQGQVKGILFSRTMLEKIEFHKLENGNWLDTMYENLSDPWKIALTIQYSPTLTWHDEKVFEISYQVDT